MYLPAQKPLRHSRPPDPDGLTAGDGPVPGLNIYPTYRKEATL